MLVLVAAAFLLLRSCRAASSAVGMAWNTSYSFGPDGPWLGLSVDIQNPNTSARETVSLIPSTRFVYSWIPTPQACLDDASNSCGVGGEITWPILDDPAGLTRNRTAGNWSYIYGGDITNVSMDFGNQVIPSATVAAFNSSNITYPSGIERGAELGIFYLGGVDLGGNPPDVSCPDSTCNPSLYLYNSGITPSYSHGMTMGSAALQYPGSLMLGGYDTGRAIGPVLIAEQQVASLIFVHSLLDIQIGVETGGNPLPPDAMTSGLLRIGEDPVTQPLLVACDPQLPYIFLPSGTTEALVSLGKLPVYLDSKSKYYLWNTSSPLYPKLVTSPAYLGFVFSVTADSSSSTTVSNITIKVPFMLLNLTLEPSVSGLDTDVPYFPVQPMDTTDFTDAWIFGRAFLQAAFWGKNWNQNVSWLAQAPGPGQNYQGLGYLPRDIAPSQTSLSAQTGANLFNDSWASYWTPLPIDASTSGSGGNGRSSALGGGAVAGIVVGSIAGVVLVGLGAFFLMRKGRRTEQAQAPGAESSTSAPFAAHTDESGDKQPILRQGSDLQGGDFEMSMHKPRELPTNEVPRPSELPADKTFQELPARRFSDYGRPKE